MPVACWSASICSATSSGDPSRKRSRVRSSKARPRSLSPAGMARPWPHSAYAWYFAPRNGAHRRIASLRDFATKTSRRAGNSFGNGLPAFVEGARVDLHLADDGVDAVVWVHVPAVAQPRRAANRRIGVGADPDRWMRLLHGAAAQRGVLQREVRAGHGHDVLGPQPLHGEEVLLEAAHALLLGRAEGQVLDLAVAEGDAEDDLASAHDVGGRDLLGDVERLVEREQDQPEVDPEIRRLGHDPAEEGE